TLSDTLALQASTLNHSVTLPYFGSWEIIFVMVGYWVANL
ncbi:unnamed protein product, partial [marine sediment metagenome]